MPIILFAYSINKHFEIAIVLRRINSCQHFDDYFWYWKGRRICVFIVAHATDVWLRVSWSNWIIYEIKTYRDIDSLLPHDVKGNCKKAFDAGETLGIPRVIEPADMDILTVPDKLAVMTYLYQLRAHFTGHELEVI